MTKSRQPRHALAVFHANLYCLCFESYVNGWPRFAVGFSERAGPAHDGAPADAGEPVRNTSRPRLPPRPNFTGTVLPAFWEFSAGGLSTGEKNPLNCQRTRNERLTSGAGFQLALPPCDAVIVQAPALVRWTVFPETVQPPAAENETANPEAVALTLKSGSPKPLFGSGRT